MLDTEEIKNDLSKEVRDMLDGVIQRVEGVEEKVKGSNEYYNKELKEQKEEFMTRHRFLVRSGQWFVGIFILSCSIMGGFAYSGYKEDHTEVKSAVKKDVKALDAKYSLELSTVKNNIAELKSSINSVDSKTDKILHILINKK